MQYKDFKRLLNIILKRVTEFNTIITLLVMTVPQGGYRLDSLLRSWSATSRYSSSGSDGCRAGTYESALLHKLPYI